MSKRSRKAPRPKTYDYTLGAFEIPDAKATGDFVSSLLPRAMVIGGLGALVYWFFFSSKAAAKENAKSAALPTGFETGGKVTTEVGAKPGTFVDPGSNVAIAGPSGTVMVANDRYSVKAGESWSNIASRVYGDYRWWPALWDANRTTGRFGNPGTLAVGDTILVPKLPVESKRFKDAIFARAELDRKWEVTKLKKGAKAAGPRPKSTFTATPITAADTAAAVQTAAPTQPALPAQPPTEVTVSDAVTAPATSAEPVRTVDFATPAEPADTTYEDLSAQRDEMQGRLEEL